jgi:uncharacterized damage-inducible protein DinB
MSTSTTGHAAPAGVGVLPTPKQQFLDAYEREHQITMRLLRAYPPDKIELRPHPRSKTARELAWMFAAERALGTAVLNDWYATNKPGSGQMPQAPADWQDLLAAIEKAHVDYRVVVESLSDAQLYENVKFFTGPRTMGDYQRIQFMWFLLSDQIHHRGQFSIYSRMADGKVPSIYGPSADEPWN